MVVTAPHRTAPHLENICLSYKIINSLYSNSLINTFLNKKFIVMGLLCYLVP